jgi:hypothetical protein
MSRYVLMVAAVALAAAGCASSGGSYSSAAASVREGVQAARRSYWQEAHFRFAAAHQLQPQDAGILNNLAVALEALGRYDEALETYRRLWRWLPPTAPFVVTTRALPSLHVVRARRQAQEGVGDGTR